MVKKIRKIKHRSPKFFGFSDEKWARGGRYGYGRNYGHRRGAHVDLRTRREVINADDRRLEREVDSPELPVL